MAPRDVIIDCSATRPTDTGLEVIGREFVRAVLAHASETPRVMRSSSKLGFLWNTLVQVPLLSFLGRRTSIFPAFPPSVVQVALNAPRTTFVVADLFLLRPDLKLNAFAQYYLKPTFGFALRRGRSFATISKYTADALAQHVSPEAKIHICRPIVPNRYGLAPGDYATSPDGEVRVAMIGTIEPRKGYSRAVLVAQALASRLRRPVKLHIIGRQGWGLEADALRANPDVELYGYASAEQAKAVISSSHMAWFASFDEGLGLGPLEVAYSGIPIVLADIAAFRETLDKAALFIDWEAPQAAAAAIEAMMAGSSSQTAAGDAVRALRDWNVMAENDVLALMADLEMERRR